MMSENSISDSDIPTQKGTGKFRYPFDGANVGLPGIATERYDPDGDGSDDLSRSKSIPDE